MTSKEYHRQWRKAHPGYYTERSRRWREEHPGYMAKACRRNKLAHPGQHYQRTKHYRKLNPEANKAHMMVNYYIHHGTLTRQLCEICANPKSQAHHPDYSKPLKVKWLCASCHKQAHK